MVFREIPISNIETTVVLLRYIDYSHTRYTVHINRVATDSVLAI